MDNDDDFDVDPAMAAAMGFSGFGNQGKKRKFGGNETFVDPKSSNDNSGAKSKPTANSASAGNATPLGKRREVPPNSEKAFSSTVEPTHDGKPTLDQLRDGVRNVKGDLVIFMPNFIEDPWANLNPKHGKENRAANKTEQSSME